MILWTPPRPTLPRAAPNPFFTQPVFVLGIVLTHTEDIACGLVELHEFCIIPPLKPAQAPLQDGISSLPHVCTTQLGVISKAAECALNPTMHITNKMLNSASPSPYIFITKCL